MFNKAVDSGCVQDVKKYIGKDDVDPAEYFNCLIVGAVLNGYEDVVKLLLEDKRVNPADNNNCSIQLASKYGHKGIVKLLLEDPRVNPIDDDNLAIKWALRRRQQDIYALLVKAKVTRECPQLITKILDRIENYKEKEEMKEFIENENHHLTKRAVK